MPDLGWQNPWTASQSQTSGRTKPIFLNSNYCNNKGITIPLPTNITLISKSDIKPKRNTHINKFLKKEEKMGGGGLTVEKRKGPGIHQTQAGKLQKRMSRCLNWNSANSTTNHQTAPFQLEMSRISSYCIPADNSHHEHWLPTVWPQSPLSRSGDQQANHTNTWKKWSKIIPHPHNIWY